MIRHRDGEADRIWSGKSSSVICWDLHSMRSSDFHLHHPIPGSWCLRSCTISRWHEAHAHLLIIPHITPSRTLPSSWPCLNSSASLLGSWETQKLSWVILDLDMLHYLSYVAFQVPQRSLTSASFGKPGRDLLDFEVSLNAFGIAHTSCSYRIVGEIIPEGCSVALLSASPNSSSSSPPPMKFLLYNILCPSQPSVIFDNTFSFTLWDKFITKSIGFSLQTIS